MDNQQWLDNITSGDYEKYYEEMYEDRQTTDKSRKAKGDFRHLTLDFRQKTLVVSLTCSLQKVNIK